MAALKLPKGTVFHASPHKKFKEVILFTHHFAGNQFNLHRHIKLVTDFGFDCISFDFSWHGKGLSFFYKPDFKTRRIGLKHQWSIEVEKVLKALPQFQPVILFSFSGPAASVIEAVVRRQKAGSSQIRALIFDSGPFLDSWYCTNNLLRYHYHVEKPALRKIALVAMMMAWGPNHARLLADDVKNLAKNMPILSIRGQKDLLVPPEEIDAVFADRGLTQFEVLEIKNCGHLVGLRDFADEYSPVIEAFLEKNSTPM